GSAGRLAAGRGFRLGVVGPHCGTAAGCLWPAVAAADARHGAPHGPARQRSAAGRPDGLAIPLVLVRGGARRTAAPVRGHLDDARKVAGPVAMNPIIEFDAVSKWYGNVIGLNKLTLQVLPGVTGL